ncbi:MAG: polymerase sigma factor RpoD, partial [Pseudomonadota bacterium]
MSAKKSAPDQTPETTADAASAPAAPKTVRVVRAAKAAAKAEPADVAKAPAAEVAQGEESAAPRRGRKAKAAGAEGETAKKADKKTADSGKKTDKKNEKGDIEGDDDFTDLEADGDLDVEADVEPDAEVEAAVEEEGEVDKPKAKPLRMKVSRAKERALMREFGLDETTLTEEEVTKRRQELKTLIKMGKTRGYLTHQEINDHLPEKLVENEILEAIISMLNDMGIAVYEQAPDAATLLIAGGNTTTATEEEAEEEAEAALSTVDSEFGRTTDPVRMYMREMGTVELLTREGEIEIAKRIEGGLQAMMLAISASPATIDEILTMADRIRAGEMQISEVVDGFVSSEEADDYVAEEDFDEFDEDEDEGAGTSKALTKKLEELKNQALSRFDSIRAEHGRMRVAIEAQGYRSTAYNT